MNGNIAIVAALPGELKPLIQHRAGVPWTRLKTADRVYAWEYRHAHGCWRAVCAGMGARRAGVAVAVAEETSEMDAVISVGWAGALEDGLKTGDTRRAGMVVDTLTGERFRTAFGEDGLTTLATSDRVADEREKARLAAAYGASMVDMEAATVARLARAHGVPFYCLKAISDDRSAHLPDFSRFIAPHGQIRLRLFMMHSAVRPHTWRGLIRLGRHSARAAARMAEAIYGWLDEDGSIRTEALVKGKR